MTNIPFKPALVCAASLCALSTARAQDKPQEAGVGFELSRVVVTAPAVGTLSSKSLLTSVDTFGGADLQDAAISNNWELFARLPGINLTNFNQGTTSGKPAMRGFNGEGEVNAVKLLIDGVPSNSNDGNMPYIDLMMPLGLQALQLRVHPSRTVEAFATVAMQEAVITEPNPAAPTTLGKEVDHIPRRLFNAGIDWQARPDLKFSAWLQGQSSYWLERTNTLTGKYGAYSTLNVGASWSVTPTLQFDAQLLNANNGRREYVWWDGSQTLHSPGEPRSLNLALRASF